MRSVVVVIVAVLFAAIGPRLGAPHDRAAGEPFVYVPPEGFTLVKQAPGALLDDEKARDREWEHPALPGHPVTPRIHLTPSTKGGTVEGPDLARISEGMPAMLEGNGVTWSELRRETRTRPDGARVGLIEGECSKMTEQFGVGELKVTYRRLLFVFPTDEGSTVTTAIYGTDEIKTWQPAFEASIDTARGVALRVPQPPQWMYFAWGAAGLVMGWLATSLLPKRAVSKRPPPPKDADA
jgi:hypothetical protein